jgi:hypothetical protein
VLQPQIAVMSTQAVVLTNGHTTSNRLAVKLYSDVKRLEIHVFVDTYSTSDPLRVGCNVPPHARTVLHATFCDRHVKTGALVRGD